MKRPVHLYLWTAIMSRNILGLPLDERLQDEHTKGFPAAAYFFQSDEATAVAALGNVAVILGGLYFLSWIEAGPTEKSSSFYKNTNFNHIKMLQEKERFVENQQYLENESNEAGSLFSLPTLDELNPFKLINPVIQNVLSLTSKPNMEEPSFKQIGPDQEMQNPHKLKKKKLFKKDKTLPELRSPVRVQLEENNLYFMENDYLEDDNKNEFPHEDEYSLYGDWRDTAALAQKEAQEFQFDKIIAKGINKIHTTDKPPKSTVYTTTKLRKIKPSIAPTSTVTTTATTTTSTSTTTTTTTTDPATSEVLFDFDKISISSDEENVESND